MFNTLVRTSWKVRLQPHTYYKVNTASSTASTAICSQQYRCQQPPLGDEFPPWSLYCITFQMMKHLSIEWLVVNQLYSQCPQKSPFPFQSFLLFFTELFMNRSWVIVWLIAQIMEWRLYLWGWAVCTITGSSGLFEKKSSQPKRLSYYSSYLSLYINCSNIPGI